MKTPIIDKRSRDDIYEELIELAKYYTPEWNTSDKNDVGIIFSNVFSNMFKETIDRFNMIPYKNFVYFLNLIGTRLLPSVCAKGYIAVELTEKNDSGVLVKRGTQLYGTSDYEIDSSVIYEVQNDLYAINNRIKSIYSTHKERNIIVKSLDREKRNISFFDFNNENLQKHRIIMSHNDIFNIKSKDILKVYIQNKIRPNLKSKIAHDLSLRENAVWEYLSKDGWMKIENVKNVGSEIELCVEEGIEENSFNSELGRWISCTINNKSSIGEVAITDIRVASKGANIEVECAYSSDICLSENNYYPFGERFNIYDDFYIGCDIVFSKKDSIVHLDFNMEYHDINMEEAPSVNINWKSIVPEYQVVEPEVRDKTIEKVLWEYWNGNGWVRLFKDERYEDIFKQIGKRNIKISFECPNDIEKSYVGAHEKYFIRARIVKVSNEFYLNHIYKTPFIKTINLSYTYGGNSKEVEKIFLEKDLKLIAPFRNGNDELEVFSNKRENPAVYIALENELHKGPIKIYFKNEYFNEEDMPNIRWEYLTSKNGKPVWEELKVLDETNRFKTSGIITFVFKYKTVKRELFGEERHWIRIINTDNLYSNDSISKGVPIFNDIILNVVKITQEESMEEEYFSIEREEEDKTCNLLGENIIKEHVWIDEYNDLSEEEIMKLENDMDMDKEIIRNDIGEIKEFWIRWSRKTNFDDTSSKDRVYSIDVNKGIVRFGNGRNGRIPTFGEKETIKIDYAITSGTKGNLSINSINEFGNSVPFISSVYNFEDTFGGCDKENIDEAIERGSKMIIHQNRGVSDSDYDILCKQADRNIFKVKSIAHINYEGEEEIGSIILAILPVIPNKSKEYFTVIKENVLSFLSDKVPVEIIYGNKLKIYEVQYVEFSISIEVKVEDLNSYHYVYTSIEESLKKYLNPINGNNLGAGFEIGELPTREKIYNYIKKINHLTYIEKFNVNCYVLKDSGREEIDYESIFKLPFAIPINGEHDIVITI